MTSGPQLPLPLRPHPSGSPYWREPSRLAPAAPVSRVFTPGVFSPSFSERPLLKRERLKELIALAGVARCAADIRHFTGFENAGEIVAKILVRPRLKRRA